MKRRFFFFLFIGSLFLINSCQKEHSFEGGAGPSEGTLQDDGSGDCLPKTVSGLYVVGAALNGDNDYIEVQVDVTVPGHYTIRTDTVNGIYFRGTGVFTATGLNTVRLRGNGTPANAGVHNFIVSYGTSGCSIAVTTSGSLATFTLGGAPGTCTGATPAGTYTVGVALTAANTVNITVNVTVAGAYNIETATANGMKFKGSGVLATGTQTIVLTGEGTPATPGATNIPITLTPPNSSSCSFVVTVAPAAAPAVYTIDCATAAVNGTYTNGTILGPTNTITVSVNVTSAGSYSITGTVNGMTFSSTPGASFTATGTQSVTLNGAGTPNTQGANTVPLTGGTTPCSVTVNVLPGGGGGGNAVYTFNCGSAQVNGTYTQNVALGAANTIGITVNVTTAGAYTITGTLNGMTFSSTPGASFSATGPQTVTLTGSGTPTVLATNAVQLTGGTTPCVVNVTVGPGAAGPAVFTVDCASAVINGVYVINTALTATNTVVLTLNVTTAGTYNISTSINGMTFSGTGSVAVGPTQTVTLTGSGTPTVGGTNILQVNAGSTPCSFDVEVAIGTWSFKDGATTYSGVFVDAGFDNVSIPGTLAFFMVGESPAGHYFELDIVDVSNSVSSGETYNCAAALPLVANAGILYLETPPPASDIAFEADPLVPGNSVVITVTTHNTTTKTVSGTFQGNARDGAGVFKPLTQGVFTVKYP
jgi:hypothetical protein